MENETTEQSPNYNFLEDERVERYFADLNLKLLSGRHIYSEDYNSFSLLEEWYSHFAAYYEKLYKLSLERDIFDQVAYYYLDFFSSGKGRLSDPSRTRMLTELQTVVGLILLDMYYVKYFDDPKIITWNDIQVELMEGENREHYRRIFFNSERADYTPTEWQNVERKFRLTINSFSELGWVERLSGQDELSFQINPAIHRFAKLYEQELSNFPDFAKHFQIKNGEE